MPRHTSVIVSAAPPAPPATKTVTKTVTKTRTAPKSVVKDVVVPERMTEIAELPMFRVILLGDEVSVWSA
jgi:hypothetical protein